MDSTLTKMPPMSEAQLEQIVNSVSAAANLMALSAGKLELPLSTTTTTPLPPASKKARSASKSAVPAVEVVAPVPAPPPATAEDEHDLPRKTRKVPIEKIIDMIKTGRVNNAVAALETYVKKDDTKKERVLSPFNLFVQQKMKELKDSGMKTNARMKECSRLWNEMKTGAAGGSV